jgi:3-isopropylmalate/(R)-2-methylmalate dehydratase small subunit
MEPLKHHRGIVAPLEALNVDTDQIIPKQFLKRIERTGYGDVLFFDWRYLDDGETPDPEFELNAPRYRGASILLTKDNFGCGSSREHAPWALNDYGIRIILAPSFADIFHKNCFNNGMLPIVLAAEIIEKLFEEVRAQEGHELIVSLPDQTITRPDGRVIHFEIDPFLRERLLRSALYAVTSVTLSVRYPYAFLTVSFSLESSPSRCTRPERPRNCSMHGKRCGRRLRSARNARVVVRTRSLGSRRVKLTYMPRGMLVSLPARFEE